MNDFELPPLSIYVHIPWCERKCPYCDFNSHALSRELPEKIYIEHLIADLEQEVYLAQNRKPVSLYLGGGTPSLLSAEAVKTILTKFEQLLKFPPDIEITLEVNPGTVDAALLRDFKSVGINRLSIGIQSFDDRALSSLGRIHDGSKSREAIEHALNAGFTNLNLDLMFGLPGMNPDDAMKDLEIAASYEVPHLSWYQLTVEPNTYFYSNPPRLPDDDQCWEIFENGCRILSENYQQYEVSAWARQDYQSRHNLNYWEFGDYLGLGAGAHGKITLIDQKTILRTQKTRAPDDYMKDLRQTQRHISVDQKDLPLEFLMNSLRLKAGVHESLFQARTGLSIATINPFLTQQRSHNLLQNSPRLQTTELGYRMLDSILAQYP